MGDVPTSHPVRGWFEKMVRERTLISQREDSVAGAVRSGVYAGYIASLFYLAYSLYLLQHHDEIPPSLLLRLRSPRSALPAVYETFVGAAFAISGHAIRAEEVKATDVRQGEFTATSAKTGKTYSVEAKRREEWRNRYSHPMSDAFASELRQYVRTRIGKAARKGLPNPVYWLELSIAGMKTREEFMRVRREVQAALREAEGSLRIGGRLPEPACGMRHSTGRPGPSRDDPRDSAVRLPVGLADPPALGRTSLLSDRSRPWRRQSRSRPEARPGPQRATPVISVRPGRAEMIRARTTDQDRGAPNSNQASRPRPDRRAADPAGGSAAE